MKQCVKRRRAAGAGAGDMPHPLTIFLTARERERVVAALGAIHPDRSRAVRIALGLSRAMKPSRRAGARR